MIKKLAAISVFLFLIICIVKFHYFTTDGFRLQKIVFSTPAKNNSADHQYSDNFNEIIDQKFHYLGKGRQVYVFVSDDNQYVIKFARDNKYKYPLWARCFSFFNILSLNQMKVLEEKKERLNRALESYKIAYDELKDDTQLIFANLDKKKKINKNIVLYDKAKRKFKINLNEAIFCVQKKAIPIKEYLSDLLMQKDIEEAKYVINGVIENVISRMNKNILNRDFSNILTNYGYDNNKFFEMDVGSFYKEKYDLSVDRINSELDGFTFPLRMFLVNNYSDLVEYFDNVLNEKKINR